MMRAADLTGLKIDILPQPNFTMEEILGSIVEDRRQKVMEQMEQGIEGDFTDAEGRLRLGHLHILKKYGLPFHFISTWAVYMAIVASKESNSTSWLCIPGMMTRSHGLTAAR